MAPVSGAGTAGPILGPDSEGLLLAFPFWDGFPLALVHRPTSLDEWPDEESIQTVAPET